VYCSEAIFQRVILFDALIPINAGCQKIAYFLVPDWMRALAHRLLVTHQCCFIPEESVNFESAKDSVHYLISPIIAAKH
jgi:hypothetical protein